VNSQVAGSNDCYGVSKKLPTETGQSGRAMRRGVIDPGTQAVAHIGLIAGSTINDPDLPQRMGKEGNGSIARSAFYAELNDQRWCPDRS
jgi:hypothetical protein